MNTRDITVEQATAYVKDPRNERAFQVMAQNADSDCPNEDDHGPSAEHPEGGCWCWDGQTVSDLVSDDGEPESLFEENGPFQLWYDEDPGEPREWTLLEKLAEAAQFASRRADQDEFISRFEKDLFMEGAAEAERIAEVLADGGQLLAAGEIEGGECPDNEDEGVHVIALNMCQYCLQYDVLGIR
jgi:hypothetical protein